jgi:hypothetical protein
MPRGSLTTFIRPISSKVIRRWAKSTNGNWRAADSVNASCCMELGWCFANQRSRWARRTGAHDSAREWASCRYAGESGPSSIAAWKVTSEVTNAGPGTRDRASRAPAGSSRTLCSARCGSRYRTAPPIWVSTIRGARSGRAASTPARFDMGPMPTHRTGPVPAHVASTAATTSSGCAGTAAGTSPFALNSGGWTARWPATTGTSGRPARSSRYRASRARSPSSSSEVSTSARGGTAVAATTRATASSGSPPTSVSTIIGADWTDGGSRPPARSSSAWTPSPRSA